MTKVLVTGAGGFIGRQLTRYLAELNHEVVCVHSLKTNPSNRINDLGQEVVRADVRDSGAMASVIRSAESVFHLAAAVSTKSLAHSRSVNVEGTRTLVRAAAACSNPPSFVQVSSLAAAGARDSPATEQDSCRPISHYGRTKLEAEATLKEFAARLPISIVRPPCVFGTGDRNMLSLYSTVQRGWNFVISSSFRYSFLHVEDLVSGLIACADRGQRLSSAEDPNKSGLYYLADPQPVTFVELADMIAETLAVTEVRHVVAPRSLCWTIGAVGETILRLTGRKTFLNLDKVREGSAGSWVCDTSRAQQQLGFNTRHNLATRIEQTTDAYKTAGWL